MNSSKLGVQALNRSMISAELRHRFLVVIEQELAEVVVLQFLSIRAAKLVYKAIRENIDLIFRQKIYFVVSEFILFNANKISDRVFVAFEF